MVLKAMEIGSLLIEKQSELKISEQRVWRKWMAENVEFSRFSAARYMKLARNGARVLHSLETGDAVSLRTALGLHAQDEKADSLEAGETEERQFDQSQPVIEDEKAAAIVTKTGSIFKQLWRVFAEPSRVAQSEKTAFLMHTAHSIQICRENNWELPAIDLKE